MSIVNLLKPNVIAVVGASDRAGFSRSTCKNLLYLEEPKKVYFINPKKDELYGKICYDSLADLPEFPDLVIMCVNAGLIPQLLKDTAAVNCHSVVLYASGYAETGKEEGKRLQKELGELCRELDISLMGPNCAGYINFIDDVYAFGLEVDKAQRIGKVGLISQSGQIALDAVDMEHMSYSYIISAGNSSVVSMEEYFDFLVEDPDTTVVSLYLEGIQEPKKFVAALEKAAKKKKPVVILKTGRSEKGSQIASSHTGSLSGADKVFDAVFKKYGVIRVMDMEELLSTAQMFATLDKLPAGGNLAVMCLSGGGTAISADLGDFNGLHYPAFSAEVLEKITALLPSYSTPNNPLDTTATLAHDKEGYAKLVKTVMSEPAVDMVICGFSVHPTLDNDVTLHIAEALVQAKESEDSKPLLMMPFIECSRAPEIRDLLRPAGVPILPTSGYGFKMLKSLADFATFNFEEKLPACGPAEESIADKKVVYLSEYEAKKKLAEWNIPSADSKLINSLDEVEAAVNELGFPLVAKICSADILHKTDIGGVKLGITDLESAKKAFVDILANAKAHCPEANVEGVLLQKMVEKGLEIIIGVKNDPQLGPAVMCGLGGVFVELFKDVSLCPAPISKKEAEEMVLSLQSAKLLTGYRGSAPLDIAALVQVIMSVGEMAKAQKDKLVEMDINPLFVYEKGVCAVDAVLAYTE
ncbi:MAG: CoA-binding protein [Clostridia bacterium]|nr:CoA-binding protein [Clostridia bacterium]